MPWNNMGVFVPPQPLVQRPQMPSGWAPPILPPLHPIGPPTIPPVPAPAPVGPAPASTAVIGLADLADLVGEWQGEGFNLIWRPSNVPGQDHFLQFNFTREAIEFKPIGGQIPNRGLLQQDIGMSGLRYFQEITDEAGNVQHIEPGLWLSVPQTSNPAEPISYVRMGSIPHGTTVLLQGVTSDGVTGFGPASTRPFFFGNPQFFPTITTSNIGDPSSASLRSVTPPNLTQAMLNDPNTIINTKAASQHITSCKSFSMSTTPTPIAGGGVANTAFLQGLGAPNAKTSLVSMTMKIQHVQDGPEQFLQLQYSQTVLLDFAGLSWPHVTVATLRKAAIDMAA